MNDDLKQIGALLNEVKGMTAPTATGSATITVNAGGVGVWLCLFCCGVMAVITLGTIAFSARELSRVDQQLIEVREENKTMQTFLAAIYQQAPHLKPKEEE